MYLDMCFPREIADAKKNNTPVVIVGGTVEYHGPQCSYGCDTLIAEGLVKKLAEKKDIIIAPTISYSPASYAVGDAASGTVHVEENAFEGCTSMLTVVLPSTLSTIEDSAFAYCSNIKTVFFGGTEEQFDAIEIADSNEAITDANLYIYSESEPTDDGNYWHYEGGSPVIW
jgi:hypothetical protein